MRYLSSALYAEGVTDGQFLKPLLQRVCAEAAMASDEPVEIHDVLELEDLPPDRGLSRERRVLAAARRAEGAWVVLFVHADADGDARRALAERVEPARELVHAELGARGRAVAVIPVRMTEAWVLADIAAVKLALGTSMSDHALGLAEVVAHGPDHLGDPKAVFEQVYRASRGRRRWGAASRYLGLIGETVELAQLRRLQAFREMEGELRRALRLLGILGEA